MSTIFRDRKIPRHLIIYDEYEMRQRRPKHRLGRLLLWSVLAAAAVYAGLLIIN